MQQKINYCDTLSSQINIYGAYISPKIFIAAYYPAKIIFVAHIVP